MNRRTFLFRGVAAGALAHAGVRAASAAKPAKSAASGQVSLDVTRAKLEQSLRLACSWITDVAQVKTDELTIEKNSHGHGHTRWRGAMRGEYRGATREWDFFAPVWHTGQAIKSLVLASAALGDPKLLEAAKVSADFIGTARIADKNDPHYGLILAFEDGHDIVNTSGILEASDGLLLLSDATGDARYAEWACAAMRWVADHAYVSGGLFRDSFDVHARKIIPAPWLHGRAWERDSRPLIDDALFLKVYRRTREPRMNEIFLATAERLLAEEEPAGNWIRFVPCNPETGSIHPRHAFWWGLPLLAAYEETHDERYRACASRAGEWYLNAMRSDGGLFRDTRLDFKTPSFGHENSGICCAIVLWSELWRVTGEARWVTAMNTALKFCMKIQFRETQDPNLRGAILERVRAPDGTDASPYDLRDLSTIFYVQAAATLLKSSLVAQ